MKFKIRLVAPKAGILPVNYSYPLSAAIYRIIQKGNTEYANLLHEKGYGKGFKLFTFSQLNMPFQIEGDRLRLMGDEGVLKNAASQFAHGIQLGSIKGKR